MAGTVTETSVLKCAIIIFKDTGKVIQRPLSEGSNKAEWESETERQLAKGLYQLREKLGRIKPMDFADDGESETPDFEVYSDDTDARTANARGR
jgi:hypothetical protein